jgi:hypothetical protein
MTRFLLIPATLTIFTLAACQEQNRPVLLSFGPPPFEYSSKPVGDPSMDPFSPGDPIQAQQWIKPPPKPEQATPSYRTPPSSGAPAR